MASFPRLESTARRVAESKWVGHLIVFSVLQWWWGSLVVSVGVTVALGLVGAGIQRTKWARTRKSTPGTEQGIGGLAVLLLCACAWVFMAFVQRPDQFIWAVVLSMTFLVYASVEFLDWRSRVADDASRGRRRPANADGTTSPQ